MTRRSEDPFYNGIPSDIEERARQWIWDRYGEQDPSESLILDIAYGIYEDDVRMAAENQEIDDAQWRQMGG